MRYALHVALPSEHDQPPGKQDEPFDPDVSETLDSSIRPGIPPEYDPDVSETLDSSIRPGIPPEYDPDVSETLDSSVRPGAAGNLDETVDPSGVAKGRVPESQAETADPAGGEEFELDSTYHPPGMPVRIAGFLIKGVIGSGGMGTVYMARQDHPRRTVAVKVINPGVTNPRALKRFDFEAQMLARLHHPGIAQIYEAGTWDEGAGGVPYFAMEYVAGAKILTDYAKDRKLDTRKRLELILQTCEAVGHGHTKGVIHRDLKPGNILVTGDGRVKIIDFGVARSTDSDAAATMATGAHDIVGTLQYMAPEQCSGDVHDLDSAADVYAIGVTAYELLSDDLPYDVSGKGLASAIRIITEDHPSTLGSVDASLRGEVSMIIAKAMSKEREDRYRTASELGDDLRRYLAGDAILACPPTVMTTLRRVIRRNKGAVLGLAIILILLSISAMAGVFALINRNQALEARNTALAEQAEKHAMVGDLISFFMRDTFDAIVPLANSQEARESVVNISLQYLDRLREQAGSDPSLQRMLSEGLQQAGINRWSLQSGNRGDVDDAIDKWEESIQISDALCAMDPEDIKSLMLSIRGRNLLVDAYRRTGQEQDRAARLEEAEAYVGLLPDPMGDVEQARIVMGVLLDRSRLVPTEGNPEETPAFSRMLSMLNDLNEAFEGDPRVVRDATIVWNRLAYAWSQRGEHERAKQWYERSLESREQILERQGATNTSRRDIVTTHRLIADQEMAMGVQDAAIKRYRTQVIPLMRELVADSPKDIRTRDDLAKGLLEYGLCMIYSGKASEAVMPLSEARIGWSEAAQRSGGDNKSDQKNTRHLLQTEISLAQAYLAAGDPSAGKAAVDRAMELAESARRQWPDSEPIRALEDSAREVRARCLETLGSFGN